MLSMQILHVFQEDDTVLQIQHVKNWFQAPLAEHKDKDVVCRCGGRRYNLSPDIMAVWHMRHWRGPGEC